MLLLKIMDSLFEKIKTFLIDERWEYDFELRPETSLQNDLKMYGDEASDILNKFCAKFDVDSSDFIFDNYFKPEPSWTDIFSSNKKYKDLKILDLVRAVESKKL